MPQNPRIEQLSELCDDTWDKWAQYSFATHINPYKGTSPAAHFSRLGSAEAFKNESNLYRSYSVPALNIIYGVTATAITSILAVAVAPAAILIGIIPVAISAVGYQKSKKYQASTKIDQEMVAEAFPVFQRDLQNILSATRRIAREINDSAATSGRSDAQRRADIREVQNIIMSFAQEDLGITPQELSREGKSGRKLLRDPKTEEIIGDLSVVESIRDVLKEIDEHLVKPRVASAHDSAHRVSGHELQGNGETVREQNKQPKRDFPGR